ncbi:MAG: HAD hydrolase-like protein, partial [Atopobiaceae bacterium]|nr:HAD hydrolase-like protein [Atopobiaceae bacterium]
DREGDVEEKIPGTAPADYSDRDVVLFDFDGTIGDTETGLVIRFTEALRRYGLSDEEIGDARRLCGPPMPAGFRDVYGFSEEEANEVLKISRAIRAEMGPGAYDLFPGTREMLEALKAAGKTLVIQTSRNSAYTHSMCDAKGIDGFFDFIVGASDTDSSDKEGIIREAMQRLGVGSDSCVVVGDRHYDVLAAHACGIPAIAVTFGAGSLEESEEAGADLFCGSNDELVEALVG